MATRQLSIGVEIEAGATTCQETGQTSCRYLYHTLASNEYLCRLFAGASVKDAILETAQNKPQRLQACLDAEVE